MNKKNLAVIAGLGVALLAGSILSTNGNVFNFRLFKAIDGNDYTISVNRSSGTITQTNDKTIASVTTSGGTKIYVVTTDVSWSPNSDLNKNYIGYLNRYNLIRFTSDPEGLNDFCFQGVNALSLIFNTTNSRTCNVKTSLDLEEWTSNSFAFTKTNSYSFGDNPAHYIQIEYNSSYPQYLTEVKISHTCINNFVDTPTELVLGDIETEYTVGKSFIEPKVYAKYANGVKKLLSNVSFSGFDSSSLGNCTVTASYSEAGINLSKNFVVNITQSSTQDPLVGTFNHTYFSMVFEENGTGHGTYYGENVTFEWVRNGENVTIKYTRGNLKNFQAYCLFADSNTPNNTLTLNGTTLTMKTYYESGEQCIFSRTLNKAVD